MKQLIVAVIVILLLSSQVYALHPASDYNKYKDKEWFKDYITGVGEGFSWANATLINAGKDPCIVRRKT